MSPSWRRISFGWPVVGLAIYFAAIGDEVNLVLWGHQFAGIRSLPSALLGVDEGLEVGHRSRFGWCRRRRTDHSTSTAFADLVQPGGISEWDDLRSFVFFFDFESATRFGFFARCNFIT
jgi:hypothetical protein